MCVSVPGGTSSGKTGLLFPLWKVLGGLVDPRTHLVSRRPVLSYPGPYLDGLWSYPEVEGTCVARETFPDTDSKGRRL